MDVPSNYAATANRGNPPEFELPLTTPMIAGQNGRVNFFPTQSAGGTPATAGFGYSQKPDALATADLMRGNWEENPVSNTFFGMPNMDYLQKDIVRQVYEQSKGRWEIDPQDIDELKIVMRAMYYQYGKNLPNDIRGQVKDLNDLVLGWSVPRILREIDAHIYYINDIDKLPVPIERPVLMSKAGTKSLPFKSFM